MEVALPPLVKQSSFGGITPSKIYSIFCLTCRQQRQRTLSTSAAISTEREPIIRAPKRTIYTAGRPPWYDSQGQQVEPFVIGICGGSASGKTTVANKIISDLDVPWVTLLSMDSFYKVLNERQHEEAARNEVSRPAELLLLSSTFSITSIIRTPSTSICCCARFSGSRR